MHRLSLLALLVLAACGPTQADLADRAAIAEARPVGEPIDCIGLQQIRHTRVRDDRTIDFYMRGGEVYRNVLPRSCPRLGFEEAFSYKTSLSRLCAVDLITVIDRGAPGIPGPTCGLGQFQPIETAAR